MGNLELELSAICALDQRPGESTLSLARWLYENCYTVSLLSSPETPPSDAEDELTSLLSAANQSRSEWLEGWRLEELLPDGRAIASQADKIRSFVAGEYISTQGAGCGPGIKGSLLVFNVRESTTLQPSYYYAFSETVSPFDTDHGMLRFYWNISHEGATALVSALTREMNRFQIPFRFKCPKKRSGYARRDAAVLYVHQAFYAITALLLESVYAEVARYLRGDTPLFTKTLAPGLGLAEDPGRSFGQHRCELLATGLLHSEGQNLVARRHAVEQEFARVGCSLEAPWLNPESVDTYPYPFPAA